MEYKAKNKYTTMLRSYKLLKQISTNNGNTIALTDPNDAADNFFNNCYHFKDWLKKDASISLKEDVEEFITKSNSLSIAADYCNISKHGGLDKKPRSGKILENSNRHIRLDLTPTGFVASARLELTISGVKYDTYLLATKCIKEWKKFLKRNKVNLTE